VNPGAGGKERREGEMDVHASRLDAAGRRSARVREFMPLVAARAGSEKQFAARRAVIAQTDDRLGQEAAQGLRQAGDAGQDQGDGVAAGEAGCGAHGYPDYSKTGGRRQ